MHLSHRRASRNRRRPAVVLGFFGAAALALAACGSSTAATASASHATTPTTAPATPPGASGTIAALTGQSMEVQNPRTGQTTVTFTTATTFTQTVAAAMSAVAVGTCVTVLSTPPGGRTASPSTTAPASTPAAVTATTVVLRPAVGGSCAHSGPGGLGARSGKPRSTGPGSSVPTKHRRQGFAAGRFASGQVASVAGTSFTVTETNPRTGARSTVAVDTTSSTAFSQTEPATATDLAVGKCVRARGPASSTGAVAARSVDISSPGPRGCAAGFRRGGLGAGGLGASRSAGVGAGTPASGVASA